jgi:hypothetical protein
MKDVRELEPGRQDPSRRVLVSVSTYPEQTRRTVWVYATHRNGTTNPFAFSNDDQVECR